MKISLYILGFLIKYGSLHGYKLKQIISKEISEFAHIKMPSIYYHLEKLEKQRFVKSYIEQYGNRPKRSVYSISNEGVAAFLRMLEKALKTEYRSEFLFDSVLFFWNCLSEKRLLNALEIKIERMQEKTNYLKKHKLEVLNNFSGISKSMVEILFRHHEYHYVAELEWLLETQLIIKNMIDKTRYFLSQKI